MLIPLAINVVDCRFGEENNVLNRRALQKMLRSCMG